MKRVLKVENEQIPKIVDNKAIYSSDVLEPDLKKAPYYDIQDLHIHIWTNGVLLQEQNHKEPVKNIKECNNTKKTRYCLICHEIFHNTELSDTKITSIDSIDKIKNETNSLIINDIIFNSFSLENHNLQKDNKIIVEKNIILNDKIEKFIEKDNLNNNLNNLNNLNDNLNNNLNFLINSKINNIFLINSKINNFIKVE